MSAAERGRLIAAVGEGLQVQADDGAVHVHPNPDDPNEVLATGLLVDLDDPGRAVLAGVVDLNMLAHHLIRKGWTDGKAPAT